MIEFLYHIDVAVFYFINHSLSNPFFDKFFPFITEVKHWYIAYIILWLVLVIKGKRKGILAAVFVLIMITVTDQTTSTFLKNLIQRIRPCNELPAVNILAGCTSSYSFPSAHAVNNFAVAVFFMLLYHRYKWALLITATLIALSRVYVGVHYPSDIIGGAILGAAFGYIFGQLVLYLDKKLDKGKS